MKVVNLNMIYVRNIEKRFFFELHRAKTNEVQYSWDLCNVSTISCSGDLIKHASEAYEKIRYPCDKCEV